MRGRGGDAGSQPMSSTAVHRSPNKLWRSNGKNPLPESDRACSDVRGGAPAAAAAGREAGYPPSATGPSRTSGPSSSCTPTEQKGVQCQIKGTKK